MLLPVSNTKILILRKAYYCSKISFICPWASHMYPGVWMYWSKHKVFFMEPSPIPTASHLFYTLLLTMETTAALPVSFRFMMWATSDLNWNYQPGNCHWWGRWAVKVPGETQKYLFLLLTELCWGRSLPAEQSRTCCISLWFKHLTLLVLLLDENLTGFCSENSQKYQKQISAK